jgi:adenylate cyclase
MASTALAREGDTERDLGLRLAGAADALFAATASSLARLYEQHFRELIRNDAVEAGALAEGRPASAEIGVAFCDLVGFTPLGEAVPAEALGDVAGRLARMAAEAASPPVRLVKTIGDAVLLTADDPGALVGTALTLVEASDAESASADHAFPQVRVGVAYGPTVARGGDVFGRAVNLASRVTAIARAGSVLATREVRDAGRDRFAWSAAHARRLKGLPEPVPLYRARPLRAEGS